ncbi:MAG: HNH endonuclease [Pirellulales bacterium]|nr:HNH endonuclease [Pirellulales bacterium]
MVAKMLERPTLVLNRNWQPVNVATVGRALTLLWNESARVVDPADFQLYTWEDWSRLRPRQGAPFIQAVRQRLRVPEVIVLAEYDRLPTAAVSFSRRNVFKRDHWTCQYCGRQGRQPVLNEQGSDKPVCQPNPRANRNRLRRQPGGEELTIDHVVPRSQGGVSAWDNCVLACIDCNKRKADRTPREAGMKLRKAPVRPAWKPLYARHEVRIESWSKFISETYWNVPLES